MPRGALAFAGQWRRNPAVKRDPGNVAAKLRGRHPDDGHPLPANAYRAPENGRVSLEIVPPQPVADDRRECFGLVAIFVASERTAQNGFYAQDFEVISGDELKPSRISLLSVADGSGSLLVQCQSRDAPEARLEVLAVGIRNVRILNAAGADGFEDSESSVIGGAAERVQDHAVDPAKDGRGGGNTQRQSEHGDGCQCRGPAEDSPRVPQVVQNTSHVVRDFRATWLPAVST